MREYSRGRDDSLARGEWAETPEDESPAARRWLNWWWRLTAPEDPGNGASLAAREHARVGRLTSAILLAVVVLSTLSLPTTLATHALTATAVFSIAMACCAAVVNRKGMVTVSALLVVASTDVALMAGVWFLPDYKLGLIWLFVAPVVIAASLLPSLALFMLVLAQCLFVLLDYMLQPNTPQYMTIRAEGNYILLLSPILGQLFIAFVSCLWVNSASQALQRADRAEELAELQEREAQRSYEEAERRRELEEGLMQMQSVLSQLANGNFHARVRPLRDAQLWQLGNTLNHFIGRLARMGQSEFTLKRTDEESRRLAEAIFVMRSGRQPIWPGSSGTPLDRVIEALTVEMSRSVSEVMNDPAAPRPAEARDDASWQKPLERASSDPIIVTGSLLPVTGALIHEAGTVRRQTGTLSLGGKAPDMTPPWLREQSAGPAPRGEVKITPVGTPAPPVSPRAVDTGTTPRQRPSADDERRRPAANGPLALPAPETSATLPSWLMIPRVAPTNPPAPRPGAPRGDRPTRPTPPADRLAGPAKGGPQPLRAPNPFAPPSSAGTPQPPQLARRPGPSLPRVRLESGSLPEDASRPPFPPRPASPTRH